MMSRSRSRFQFWFVLALAVISCSVVPVLAREAALPRHPAPSPDGSLIAFSWQGDLWVVEATGGQARRLTAHPAAERHPVWSRDGQWLAFASDRHGSLDVFVMPGDGSEPPRRLTHASLDDEPTDFTPDGTAVVFSSRRAESVRWMPGLYSVPVSGGTPTLVQPAHGRHGRFSPDGDALVFVRGESKWNRRGYRGAANRDLWLRTAQDEYLKLTEFAGDDDCPSWLSSQTIAFLSARGGRKNVFLLATDSGSATQLTNHQGSDVRSVRASANGAVIAYEFEDALWTVSPSGEPARLTIEVTADIVDNQISRHVKSRDASEFRISPDGGDEQGLIGWAQGHALSPSPGSSVLSHRGPG